jgi:hypothetical protein
MALPTILHPTYTIELPILKQKITFRPFLVKEKKILLMAFEGKEHKQIYRAICQVATNCTLGKHDVATWPMLDIQFFFLKLRCVSVGEASTMYVNCTHCKEKMPYVFKFDNVKIQTNEAHSKKIPITDKMGIVMKYPKMTLDDKIDPSMDPVLMDTAILKECIDYLYDSTTTYPADNCTSEELEALIDNLDYKTHDSMVQFLKTMPSMVYEDTVACKKCNQSNYHKVTNLTDFFI